jgi:hypothetical protein
MKDPTMTYIMLSYCWDNHIPVRLCTDNYPLFLKGMELNNLSKTYRDAIMVIQKLRVAFSRLVPFNHNLELDLKRQ